MTKLPIVINYIYKIAHIYFQTLASSLIKPSPFLSLSLSLPLQNNFCLSFSLDQVLANEDEDEDFIGGGSVDGYEDDIVISDFPCGLKPKTIGLVDLEPNAPIVLGFRTWDLKKLGFEERKGYSIEGFILGLILCGVFLLENS